VCCSVLQCVAVCCNRQHETIREASEGMLQYAAVCCSELQFLATDNTRQQETTRETSEGLLQCVAVY